MTSRRTSDSFSVVLDTLETLSELLPLRETLDRICHHISALMGFRHCAILLPDSDGRRMSIEGSHGFPSSYVHRINNDRHIGLQAGLRADGPTSRAFRERGIVLTANVMTDPSFAPWRELAVAQGYRSLLSVPLLLQGQVIGVLNGYGETALDLSDEVQDLLMAVAAQAALAIELNRRLTDQKRTIAKYQELAAELDAQRDLLLRTRELDQYLTEMVLAGSGMEEIAAVLSRLLGNPVQVWDQFGHLICSAAPGGADAAPFDVTPLLATARIKRYLRQTLRRGEPEVISAKVHPELKWDLLLAPMRIGKTPMGFVGAIQVHRRLSELDIRAVRQGAVVLTLAATQQRAVLETEQRLRADFVNDLLAGRFESDTAVLQRARLQGIDLSIPHHVVVVGLAEPKSGTASPHVVNEAARIARDSHPHTLHTVMSGRLVILWPLPQLSELPSGSSVLGRTPKQVKETGEALREHLSAALTGVGVSVTVGGVCRSPVDFPRSYQEALACLRVLDLLRDRNRTLCVDDLGLFRSLLFNLRDSGELVEQARNALQPLIAHDRERGTELLHTLETYVENDFLLQGTAQALFIHRNTLKYRLQRVEQLCGRDLKQPYDTLFLTLAVAVWRLLAKPVDLPRQGAPADH